MKIWNKPLGFLLPGLTLLVCLATVIVALFSHRHNFSQDQAREASANGTLVKPVGPYLSAAFDTIRSGARQASFHIPEDGATPVGEPAAPEPEEEEPFHSPLAAFDQERKIEASLENHVRYANLALDDGVEALEEDSRVVEGGTAKGDTIAGLLASLDAENAAAYARAAKKVYAPGALRPGRPWRAFLSDETGRLARFEYEIDDARMLLVEGDVKPEAKLVDIDYELKLARLEGAINDNLFSAVVEMGESPRLADRLAGLFGSEINFIRQLRQGDSFSVLVEKKFRNGEFRGYGRILAARFINRGKLHEAFLFRDQEGRAQYFNANGENLRKTLLQAPLAVTRATSGFSESRMHPILNVPRPHRGVDYGAPHGTPVMAVGDGVVIERGWSGGYGNLLAVRHEDGLESLYAHLSGFARGMQPGQKVLQGQVIGFVGSTGLATGPHLDFRLRRNGAYINPEKAVSPRAAPVSPALKKEFEKAWAAERACLDGERKIENYSAESIIAPVLASFDEPVIAQGAKERKETRQERYRRLMLERRAALRRFYLHHKKQGRGVASHKGMAKSRKSTSSQEARKSEKASAAEKHKKRS